MTIIAQVVEVPTSQVVPGDNDRKAFDHIALEDLATSIKAHGLAQPITVRPLWSDVGALFGKPDPRNVTYQIVAGERRFRAISQILGWNTILAMIREDLDDESASAIMLAENTGRADLNPIEEANAYQSRIDRFGWSIARLAEIAGVSDGLVKSRLSLLELVPDIQHLVANGHLSLGFAQAMSKLDANRQRMAAAWLRDQSSIPTLRVFTKIVGELYSQQVQDAMFDLQALFQPQVVAAIEGSESGQLCEMLPTMPDLPNLPTKLGGMGRLIDDYTAELLSQGKIQAARVMMDFWAKAMQANYANVNAFESKTLAALT